MSQRLLTKEEPSVPPENTISPERKTKTQQNFKRDLLNIASNGGYFEDKPTSSHRELAIILKELKFITESIKNDEKAAAVKNDWKFAAMVLDRLCLIAFTIFTVVATLALFGTAPHILVS